MNNRYIIYLVCLLVVLQVFTTQTAWSQGNLLVMPRRVVFNGPKRSQEINLANTGKDTARYVISVINMRMTESGSFEIIEAPDSAQLFAGKYLRFFPHSVTLGPNESQVIKMQLNKSGELAPGEYRSHLYFRAVPKESPLGDPASVDSSGISIRLVPVFGISIPVIIRIGEPSSTLTLSALAVHLVEDSLPALQMTFNRSGSMSVYGDVAVDFIPATGRPIRVGTVNGLAVYTPNPLRRFNLMLDNTKGINYHNGKLHVTVYDQNISKPVKIAEAQVILN